jgi:hypothetical protein
MPQPSPATPGNKRLRQDGEPGARRGALARELSLLKADDRNRLNAALRTKHDNGLLMLELTRGTTRKFRMPIFGP